MANQPKRSRKKQSPWQRFRSWAGPRLKRVIIAAVIIIAVVVGWFFLTLPSIDQLYEATKAPSVVVKAEDGRIIGSYGDTYGDFLVYRELPKPLIDAVLATEDRNFFHHFGIDPFGLLRAIYTDVRARGMVQGGSTITQQVAKNVFLTPERTLSRKLREMALAFKLEARFSKQEILAIYLNRVYLGAGSYGVDAAAKRYFGKSARDLNVAEAAIIAGLLKAPSRYAPTGNPKASSKRGEQVLHNMVDAGLMKPEAEQTALKLLQQTILKTSRGQAESARYYSDWIMDQLQDIVGELHEDVVVNTTFRPEWQQAGEQAIASIMDEQGAKLNASQAALVAMTPDGAVRVMIGGRSYAESQYNRAAQAHRQPGSSFKLFVYLAGLESGLTPNSLVVDQPVTFDGWSPKNFSGDYKGEMELKDAVAQSLNTVAVQVAERAGLDNVVNMAHRLGIEEDLLATPSLALGSNEVTLVEMVGAYAHMAANGAIVQPYGIVSVQSATGETLYERLPPAEGRALNESVVGMMNILLEGVIQHGTGRGAAIGRPAAGKTGTTSDYHDAWFMGYTPDLAAGVWVGNDDNTPMKKVTGGTLPAPIWRNFMTAALANTPPHDLPTYTGFWQSIMPSWANSPPQNPATTSTQAPVNPPATPGNGNEGFHLKPTFWNKLFKGNSDSHVEHSYPTSNKR